ncbi:MAG: cyclic nucleotide-binding domain-containing protein [Gemmataceae bacterium]
MIWMQANLDPWELNPSEHAGVIAALVVTLLLVPLMPVGQRGLVRGPIILLLAFFAIFAIDQLLPNPLAVPLEFVADFFLMCSVGRGLFLILFESRLARFLLPPMPKIIIDLAQGLIYIVFLAVMLGAAGVNTSSLVTGSALLTAVIGLSMRDSLGNLFAGLAIQVERPFEVNDWIQFDDRPEHIGKVLEINWRATRVVTLDAVIVNIPNSVLAQAPIRNFTQPNGYSRRSIYVTAPYTVPTQRVHQLILEAIADSWGVLAQPAPSVITHAFTERGVEYWVRFFTFEFGARDKVDGGVRDRIWYALRRNDIAIPGPIRRVQLQNLDRRSEEEEKAQQLQERRHALACVDFLAQLPEQALDRLARAAEHRHYAAGEVILREGDDGTDLFIISEGEVVVSSTDVGGRRFELDRLGADHFFGELSLMTGQRRSATVTAVRDCEVFAIDKSALEPILAESPELAEKISVTLAHRQAARQQRKTDADSAAAEQANFEKPYDLLLRIREFFSLTKK